MAKSASLNPANRAISVQAVVKAQKPDGTILARGASSQGYALVIKNGAPEFWICTDSQTASVKADRDIVGEWVHLAAVLTENEKMKLYVDGALIAAADAPALIASDPYKPMEIGADKKAPVGSYGSPFKFQGLIDDVKIYAGALPAEKIKQHANQSLSP